MDAIIPAAIVIATTAAPTDALTRAAISSLVGSAANTVSDIFISSRILPD